MSAFLLVLFLASGVHSARILGIFPVPSVSHQAVFHAIYRELSLRGHELVVFTPNPLNDPSLVNLTEVDVSYLYKYATLEDFSGLEPVVTMKKAFEWTQSITQSLLEDPNFLKVCNNQSQQFDLVIIESFTPVFYSVSAKFKTPVIGIITLEGYLHDHWSVGNPIHPAMYADMMHTHHNLNLWQKMKITYYLLWYKYFYETVILPKGDALARRYLGDDLPYLGGAINNVSMLFLSTNPIAHVVRPSSPAVVHLGFMHVKKPKPLPKDIKSILDSAKNGAIYFSLGSNIKSSTLPKKVKDVIIAALSELPYTVLWKWESDYVPGVAPNVVTRKWFPQQDILVHPNLKVFVTQGGLQSLEETITSGVPVVFIPFIREQVINAQNSAHHGVGLCLDFQAMTKEDLKEAIIEVAENKKYKERIVEAGRAIRDQPLTSLEKAVWWTEYVIRHKGAKYLRSPSADISLFDYLLLDVLAASVIGFSVIIYVLFKVLRYLSGLLVKNKKIKWS